MHDKRQEKQFEKTKHKQVWNVGTEMKKILEIKNLVT